MFGNLKLVDIIKISEALEEGIQVYDVKNVLIAKLKRNVQESIWYFFNIANVGTKI